jgi:hypothetical protein
MNPEDFSHAARIANPMRLLEQRRGLVNQIAENSARLARVSVIYKTTGAGSVVEGDAFMFGIPFPDHPPAVMYGSVLSDVASPTDVPAFCSGSVYQWVQDANNMYVGAHVCVLVTGGAGGEIEHHFTFMGVALKYANLNGA